MKKAIQLWQAFSARPDHWLFYAFLFSATLSIRKILFFYPLKGSFNEYSGVYIYLSDILLIATLIAWVISVLYNNNLYLSNNILSIDPLSNCSTWNNLMSKSFKINIFFRNCYNKIGTQVIHRRITYLFLLFLLIALYSIFSTNLIFLALYKEIKLIEFFLLFIFVTLNVPRGTFLKNTLWITIFSGIANSFVAIIQFTSQHSIGFAFLNESHLNSAMDGVAKVIFGGEKYIRAYGLFPHPNILGGFLLFSILTTSLFFKMFHVEHSKLSEKIKCSTWNKNICKSFSIFSKTHLGELPPIYSLFIGIQVLALLFTFSKSAIIGLIIAVIYIKIRQKPITVINNESTHNVPRGTFMTKINPTDAAFYIQRIFKMFHVEHLSKKIMLMLLIIGFTAFILRPDLKSFFIKSLTEREFYLNVPRGTLLDSPLLGIGLGQSILTISKLPGIEIWQIQPIHNVFLIIFTELGLIGLLVFCLFLLKMFHVEQFKPKTMPNCSTWNNSHNFSYHIFIRGIVLGFMFIALFDHYFWDIQQGSIIFWLSLALLASNNCAKKD